MINLKINSAFLLHKQYKKITFAAKYANDSITICGIIMKFIKKYSLVYQSCILLIGLVISSQILAQEARFVVVLDAGHGGHDPGAVGILTREKDINLAVVLFLGEMIETNYNDVKVVYTRKNDKYLTLQERADIVNNNHANLFICIHTNAAQSASAYGAETFTLGLAKSKSNLDVAMRENSVILLEKDYKTKYKGFDPASVESYIMFEFMQDKYIDKSIEFSTIIQKEFVSHSRRLDRGVRQAGFWVLHRSACPSVLIELGFISNRAEERYLASDEGRKEMAAAIYNSFVEFKKTHDKMSGKQVTEVAKIEKSTRVVEPPKNDPVAKIIENSVENKPLNTVENKPENKPVIKPENKPVTKPVINTEQKSGNNTKPHEKETISLDNLFQKPIFKVQLFATTKDLKLNAPEFKGLKNTEFFVEGGYNKHTIGSETDYAKIEQIRKDVLDKFPQAFIIAFVGNKKLLPKEVLELIKTK